MDGFVCRTVRDLFHEGNVNETVELLLKPASPWLPPFLLDLNLIRAFLWYIAIMFCVSMGLRLRFYLSIYNITRYIAESCPSVFRLVHEHWFLCVRDKFLWQVGIYGGVVVAYLLLSRLVWPTSSISIQELADWNPAILMTYLLMIGVMIAVDVVLTVQTSVVDEERIIQDLEFAERWLGGKVYNVLQVLGRWNPIKNYADNMTAQTMLWLNVLFHGSIRSMIAQTTVRVIVGTSLFVAHFTM